MGTACMKYPIGVQDFEKLRGGGFVYVDKTKFIHDLVANGNSYFLSRPRRFGKSLLVSTLEAYFLGKKELFEGLAIERLETEWAVYPVFHLDLNTGRYDSVQALHDEFHRHLEKWEAEYGDQFKDRKPSERFLQVIELAYRKTGRQAVVLVDEYDKPLVSTFDNPQLQDELRAELKSFYSVLKTQDRYVRFALLTGVTKFGKVSVFSDLNNLNDISMDKRYAAICGITEEELHAYFDESIRNLAQTNGMTFDEACQKLKDKYDGYHFCYGCKGIYNPFSLLNALSKTEIGDWWFETGTPTFLVQLLKKSDYDLNQLQHGEILSSELYRVNNVEGNPIPMIYQSGYLTIKGYDKEFETYTLGFPNNEVERGFIKFLIPQYVNSKSGSSALTVTRFVKDVESGDAEGFMTRLQTFFEDADYRIAGKKEIYFQNVMFVIFKMMGFYTEVERTTARGRIDVVIRTSKYIYIIECKLDGSADEALAQIEAKGYAKPYALDERKLFKIGVNFSSKIRGVAEWKIVE